MQEAWLSEVSDELTAALVDARACAAACDELLEAGRERLDAEQQERLLAAVVAPAAISHVLIDLIDRPPPLLLAAARICRETSLQAVAELERLELPLATDAAGGALRRVAESCGRLLEAAAPD